MLHSLKCKVASFPGNCVPKWPEGVLAALRNDADVMLRIDECRVALFRGERQIAVPRCEVSGAGGCRYGFHGRRLTNESYAVFRGRRLRLEKRILRMNCAQNVF